MHVREIIWDWIQCETVWTSSLALYSFPSHYTIFVKAPDNGGSRNWTKLDKGEGRRVCSFRTSKLKCRFSRYLFKKIVIFIQKMSKLANFIQKNFCECYHWLFICIENKCKYGGCIDFWTSRWIKKQDFSWTLLSIIAYRDYSSAHMQRVIFKFDTTICSNFFFKLWTLRTSYILQYNFPNHLQCNHFLRNYNG